MAFQPFAGLPTFDIVIFVGGLRVVVVEKEIRVPIEPHPKTDAPVAIAVLVAEDIDKTLPRKRSGRPIPYSFLEDKDAFGMEQQPFPPPCVERAARPGMIADEDGSSRKVQGHKEGVEKKQLVSDVEPIPEREVLRADEKDEIRQKRNGEKGEHVFCHSPDRQVRQHDGRHFFSGGGRSRTSSSRSISFRTSGSSPR